MPERPRESTPSLLVVLDQLWTAERPWQHALHRQLVHGDFWGDNVLFDGDKVVAILDLDFMEERPRIDNLALVLYCAYLPAAPPETGGAQAPLAALVRAYSEAAEPPLTSAERSVLPFAIARTCLHFTRHMALRIREDGQRQVVEANLTEIDWGLAMVSDAKRWQEVFAE